MTNIPDMDTAEVFFSRGDGADARALRRVVEMGALRRIHAGIYIRNLDSPLEAIILRNWVAIVSHLLPGAVLAYRSALEHAPAGGVLYVRRGRTRRRLELPGLTIEMFSGVGAEPLLEPLASDLPYRKIYMPSEARGFLENMGVARGNAARMLPREDIQARLHKILMIRGDFKLKVLRDQARAVAYKLGMVAEGKRLDRLIGTLLGGSEKNTLDPRVPNHCFEGN
jgi:hypothetical protein